MTRFWYEVNESARVLEEKENLETYKFLCITKFAQNYRFTLTNIFMTDKTLRTAKSRGRVPPYRLNRLRPASVETLRLRE